MHSFLLPGLAVAQALGILSADVFAPAPVSWIYFACVLVLAMGVAGRGARLRLTAGLLAAGLSGAANHAARLAESEPSLREPLTSSFEAVVGAPSGPEAWRLDDLRAASRVRLPRRAVLHVEPGSPLAAALPGERWRLHGTLRAVGGLRNPGGRDRTREWRRRGIGARLRASHPELAVRVGDEGEGLRRRLRAWRRERSRRLAAQGEPGALLAALALGDRHGISFGTRDTFAALGISHLLAVSGLHLSLVGGMTYGLARRAAARSAWIAARHDVRTFALAAALVAAGCYALLTGPAVPVRRAFVLLSLAALALAARRPRRATHPLAFASLLILTFEPHALFEVGYQFSFAATAGLLFARTAPSTRRGVVERAKGLAGVSATAILATAAIAAFHFGRIAPIGVLVNGLAIPATAVALLPAAFVATLASTSEGAFCELLFAGAQQIASAFLAVTARIDAIAPAAPATPRPAPLTLALCALLAVAALRQASLAVRCAALGIQSLLLVAMPAVEIEPRPPRTVFFDVGQGDATLVEGRSGTLLIDAGWALPGRFDAGRDVIVPGLRALGVTRLSRVLVSHGDLDHRGGVPALLEALPVGAVWLPPGGRDATAFAAVREVAAARGVPVLERGQGDPPARIGDLEVAFLWPPREEAWAGNDGSLVVRVEVAGQRLLLPGDLETGGERRLLASGEPLRADLLKLGHHGSRTSSSEAWLAAVAPRLAIASAPCRGRFDMPHAEVRARLAADGRRLVWTGRDGAIVVGLAPRLRVVPWAEERSGCTAGIRRRRSWPPPPVFPGETR